MTAFYILNSEGKCTSVLNGDTQTLLLNIPQDSTYTVIEPENMFEQIFNMATQVWEYLPEEDEYPEQVE